MSNREITDAFNDFVTAKAIYIAFLLSLPVSAIYLTSVWIAGF